MNFLKSANAILTSMMTWIATGTTKITDFNIGSAIRTLLESISLQLEEFYFKLHQAVNYAIDNSIYEAFDFTKKTAQYATGYVTITFKNEIPMAITIPEGTQFSTPLSSSPVIYYKSTEEVIAIAGSLTAEIPVQCTIAGSIGNLPSNSVTNIVMTNAFIASITNQAAFNDGTDEESAVSRKARFKDFIKSLQRGTKEAIAYGIKSVTGVAGVWIDDNYIGFVRAYVHDAYGELPDTLKTAILNQLDDYRAAGIEVEVLPVVKVPVNISLNLILEDSADIDSTVYGVRTLVTSFLNNFRVAENLYMSNLLSLITTTYKGIIINIEILNGTDSNIQNNELIQAGTISVTGVHISDWR